MKNLHHLARAVAATAVAGIALVGMSGIAGATTISISVPPLLGGSGTSHPIVTVGNGILAPAPGVDASAPVHAEGHVPSSKHATASLPVSDPTGVTNSVTAVPGQHVWLDACLAAAVLSGHSPSSCPNALGGVASSLPVAISGFGSAAALPAELANVGGCVKLALESGAPVDTCTTPASIDPGAITGAVPGAPSLPGTGLGSLPTGDLGTLPTGDLGSLPTTIPGVTAIDTGMVSDALANTGLCAIGQELGLSGLLVCSNSAAAPGVPTGTAGNPLNPDDMCLGLAAVIHVDTDRCSQGSVSTPQAHERATVKARHDGGEAGVQTTAPEAQLNSSCTAHVASASSSSPFSPTTAGGFAGIGFAIAALGRVLRRLRRPALA